MPQAVGALLITAAGFSVDTAPAWLPEVIGAIVLAAASYGASAALAPSPSLSPASQKQNIRQAVAPKRTGYGRTKMGGILAFLEVRSRANLSGLGSSPHLHSLVMFAGREFDAFEEYWLGDQEVTLNGSNLVNESPFFTAGVRRAKLITRLGTSDQTAHSDLVTYFPGEWTDDHRLRDIPNILGIFKSVETQSFNKVFPNGIPLINVVARMSKLWDPADVAQDPDDSSTWTWDDNLAKCALDYGWADAGMRLPRELFELASDDWIAKIAICDEQVPLVGGSTEDRYRLAGLYEWNRPPREVLPLLLEPAGARLKMRADGAIILDLPVYYAPTVIFDEDSILDWTMQRSPNAEDVRNEIRARYLSVTNGYVEQEAEPWRNEASIAVDGVKSVTLDLTWCPSHAQARRRMKLEAYRRNPEWVGTITTNFYGLDSIGENLITVRIPELDINGTFERTAFKFDPETGTCVIGIRSMPAEAFEWDEDDEEGLEPSGDETDPDEPEFPPLEGDVEVIDL